MKRCSGELQDDGFWRGGRRRRIMMLNLAEKLAPALPVFLPWPLWNVNRGRITGPEACPSSRVQMSLVASTVT
jgi:hypothetical protein